jgi:FKBP-type peptidyl-prolyl cis-trans isomerase FklB
MISRRTCPSTVNLPMLALGGSFFIGLPFVRQSGTVDNLFTKRTMKKLFVTMVCLSVVAPLFADGTNQFTDEKSRVSYAVGIMTGHQWKQQMLDLDPDIYGKAIKDVLAGNPELMTEAEIKDTLTVFQKEFRAKQQARMAELATKSKSEGEAFLAANKNQPGVQTLPDGLQYLVITNGSGPVPAATDTVTVNYRGTLVDGTEFTWAAHLLRGWQSHSRLDGGAGENAGRLQMEIVHPV